MNPLRYLLLVLVLASCQSNPTHDSDPNHHLLAYARSRCAEANPAYVMVVPRYACGSCLQACFEFLETDSSRWSDIIMISSDTTRIPNWIRSQLAFQFDTVGEVDQLPGPITDLIVITDIHAEHPQTRKVKSANELKEVFASP